MEKQDDIQMSHGGGAGDGALAMVPVDEAAATLTGPPQPALDVAPKAPELKPSIQKRDAGHLTYSPCHAAHGEDWVTCDYARFGCDAPGHPCCCPADACGFAGPRQMLLHHISAEHSTPVLVIRYGQPWALTLLLSQRWHVLVGDENEDAERHREVFLVFAAAEGAAVSLLCVRADDGAPRAPQFSFRITVEHPDDGARLTLESPRMSSSSLAGGLPEPGQFRSLQVPREYLSGDSVPLSIHIDKLAPPPPPTHAAAIKSAAIDQSNKKRKSTNPRKHIQG